MRSLGCKCRHTRLGRRSRCMGRIQCCEALRQGTEKEGRGRERKGMNVKGEMGWGERGRGMREDAKGEKGN